MPGNKPNNKYLFHKFEAANNTERSHGTQASRLLTYTSWPANSRRWATAICLPGT